MELNVRAKFRERGRRSIFPQCEAELHRLPGEIALKSPELDAAKAQTCFERALAVARQQHAKSWELRASMSLARLGRDQGKVQQARELLAPVYGWFTEGFDTRDLKEAKALWRSWRREGFTAKRKHIGHETSRDRFRLTRG